MRRPATAPDCGGHDISWLTRHRLRRFFKYSFWLFPSLALIGAWTYGKILVPFVPDVGVRILDEANINGASAVLAASMLTFVVYAVSALLLAVPLASGLITPRLISLTYGRCSKNLFGAVMLLFSISDVGARTPAPAVTVPAN